MTNRSTIFVHSIKSLSLTVMVMMWLMNTYIDNSVAVMSTAKGSVFEMFLVDCCLSSCGSKNLCCEFRLSVSQELSWRRSIPRSIFASPTVVYYSE